MRSIAALVLAASLAACATTSGRPEPVDGKLDTTRFKVYLANHATDSAADQAAKEGLDAFKAKNGYASYTVVERRYNAFPTYIEYTVRFSR